VAAIAILFFASSSLGWPIAIVALLAVYQIGLLLLDGRRPGWLPGGGAQAAQQVAHADRGRGMRRRDGDEGGHPAQRGVAGSSAAMTFQKRGSSPPMTQMATPAIFGSSAFIHFSLARTAARSW
jgi:hypothetical protein